MFLAGSSSIVNYPMQWNLHCIRPNNLVNATPHSLTGLEETAPPQAERTPCAQYTAHLYPSDQRTGTCHLRGLYTIG